MKVSLTPNSQPSVLRGHQLLIAIGFALIASIFTSCSSAPEAPTVPLQASHWHKVKTNPPVYYPKGVPADHEPGFSDGQWIYSGDAAKTGFYIPLDHARFDNLAAQARSTMTKEGRKRYNESGGEFDMAGVMDSGLRGVGGALLGLDDRIKRSTGQASKGGAHYNEQTRRQEQY